MDQRTLGAGLVRATLLNLAGQIAPAAVALLCLPLAVHGYGSARFGTLTLSWAVLASVAAFDFGLGRAATRFLGANARRDDGEARSIIVAATSVQCCLGVAGAASLIGLAPWLASTAFDIPAELRRETILTLRLAALAVPIVMVSTVLQGALYSANRFAATNLISALSSSLTYVAAAVGALAGWPLSFVVLLIVLSKAVAASVLWRETCRNCVGLTFSLRPDWTRVVALIRFGSWLTISSLVFPVLKQAERFVIPAALSLSHLTTYTVPFDAISRIAVIPLSATTALFPAFSRVEHSDRERARSLFARPARYLFVTLTPILTGVALFAHQWLELWMGAPFSEAATRTTQIIAVTFFVNSFANLLRAAIQGLGRPDLKAKLDVANAALFVVLLWQFTMRLGIVGAALARLTITTIEVAALLRLTTAGVAPDAFSARQLGAPLRRDVTLAVSFGALSAATALWLPPSLQGVAFVLLVLGYLITFATVVADDVDRAAVRYAGRLVAAPFSLMRDPIPRDRAEPPQASELPRPRSRSDQPRV